MNSKKIITPVIFLIMLMAHVSLYAQDRFPRPEFESGYEYHVNQFPLSRAPFLQYIDVAILIVALSVTSWLALKKRSRAGLIWMSVFSLAYFGFYRQGCICSVGSVQNVSLALFSNSYAIPFTALLFFIIPLLFALFFGRVFCAGVCPLGAIQELTGIKPLNMPKGVEMVFAAVPFAYLALAVIFSATNSQFIICRYDPFIGIFRLDAPYTMVIFGGLLLLAGVFVNRPYCRFLCPYGVILNVFSRFAGKHISITPASCTNCRLCENACPYNAILPATENIRTIPDGERKKFITYMILVPVFAIAGALLMKNMSPVLAGIDQKVRLAREIRLELEAGEPALSEDAIAYKESGLTEQMLFEQEASVIGKFDSSAPWAGIFLGASLGFGLISLTVRKRRDKYQPDQGKCFSCGRCFKYCPVKSK